MKKPTIREQIMAMKSQKARERKENFRKKFEAAPKLVQDEYHLCEAKIKKFFDQRPPKTLLQPFKEVLYDPQNGSLTEAQIVQLHELLHCQGWEVVLTAALDWPDKGKSRRPIGLLFRYTPKD
jgi:hypothetical protein